LSKSEKLAEESVLLRPASVASIIRDGACDGQEKSNYVVMRIFPEWNAQHVEHQMLRVAGHLRNPDSMA